MQIDVSTADFGEFDFEKPGIKFQLGCRNFTDFDGTIWLGNYGDNWHLRRIASELQMKIVDFRVTGSPQCPDELQFVDLSNDRRSDKLKFVGHWALEYLS